MEKQNKDPQVSFAYPREERAVSSKEIIPNERYNCAHHPDDHNASPRLDAVGSQEKVKIQVRFNLPPDDDYVATDIFQFRQPKTWLRLIMVPLLFLLL